MPNRPTSSHTGQSGLTTLQGQVERVTFYNDETDFTIARLKVSGDSKKKPYLGEVLMRFHFTEECPVPCAGTTLTGA